MQMRFHVDLYIWTVRCTICVKFFSPSIHEIKHYYDIVHAYFAKIEPSWRKSYD